MHPLDFPPAALDADFFAEQYFSPGAKHPSPTECRPFREGLPQQLRLIISSFSAFFPVKRNRDQNLHTPLFCLFAIMLLNLPRKNIGIIALIFKFKAIDSRRCLLFMDIETSPLLEIAALVFTIPAVLLLCVTKGLPTAKAYCARHRPHLLSALFTDPFPANLAAKNADLRIKEL